MACSITKGRNSLPCKDAVSGLKNIYIFEYDQDINDAITVSSTEAGHIVTDISGVADFYKYQLKNDANTFEENSTSSANNGSTMYTQTLNVTTTKVTKEMQFQTKMLAIGYHSVVIEDMAGNMYLFAKGFGAEVQVKASIGGTLDAFSGYNLVFTGKELNPVFILDDTSKASVIANTSAATVTE